MQCKLKSYLLREGTEYPKNWNKETMEFFRNAHPYPGHLVAVIETIDEQLKEIEWYGITLRG